QGSWTHLFRVRSRLQGLLASPSARHPPYLRRAKNPQPRRLKARPMKMAPDILDSLSRVQEEIDKSFAALEAVSSQIHSIRDSVAETSERPLSAPLSPKTRPNKPLREPAPLLAHRELKSQRNPLSKAAPTLSTKSGAGVESTQLRLHGRWMDLATQSAEGPTSNRKTKIRNRMSSAGESEGTQISKHKAIEPFHPQSMFRLCWDMVAMTLIFGDTVTLPLALAWDVQMGGPDAFSQLLQVSFWVSLTFWSSDLLMNLNTATYRRGVLVTSRLGILVSYARGWLLFDVCLLTFDAFYVGSSASVSSELRLLRVTRILRLLRLLRMLKLTKVNSIIEETAANSGRQWVTVVIAITNTSIAMIFCAHVLTCMWYWVGRTLTDDVTSPVVSWIELAEAQSVAGWVQYLHAMRWIINSPSPPLIDAASGVERGLDILVSVFVIAVMGSAISKISGTIAELRAMNEARDRRRREVRQYLSSQHVSFELVSRIMRFVDYRLEKVSSAQLDTSLISPTLQLELYVGQRSSYVMEMPIFRLLSECYHEVFGALCAALMKNVYEKGESVFIAGSWVSYLHITATGEYDYIEGFDTEGDAQELSGIHWFGELSLYTEGTLHQSSLCALSFAETFTLAGPALADCVKQSRGCMAMFCDYAKDFVSGMQGTKSKSGDRDQKRIAEECCKKNQHYQDLYPDPKTRLRNIQIPIRVSRQSSNGSAIGGVESPGEGLVKQQTMPAPIRRSSDSRRSNESIKSVHFKDQDEVVSNSLSDTMTRFRPAALEPVDPGLDLWLKSLRGTALDGSALASNLQDLLPELHPEHSPHLVFEQAPERDRAESSCISILALLKDRYDIFTQPQPPNVKLKDEQWTELQELMTWIDPDLEQVHAVLVVLAIRALGKSKAVLQQMPRTMRRPERAVLQLMDSERNVVPSVLWLSPRSLTFIEDALAVHELFNLAQMLQGENLPANVAQLRDCIAEKGQDVFRFYILFLLGFMSGIAAGQGSRFMNGKNATSVISGIQLLKRLMECSPGAIYWGYLEDRAHKLRIDFHTAEDLVLTRLSCLARVQDEKDYLLLRTSWDALKARERLALTDHFLADGIKEQAFVLEFLPNCMANAKANSTVGLAGLLGVLVDLLNNLNTSIDSMPEMEKVIPVDLSEMAEFIAVVQNRFVFLTCVSRCQLQFVGQRVYLKMTGSNWGRTTDPDSDMTSLAYTLQDILQKQEVLEARRSSDTMDIDKAPKRSYPLERISSFDVRQEAF
ncbi:unnamed protein product, partial [Effrenium voratum]